MKATTTRGLGALALAALLVGACASGADTRKAPEAAVGVEPPAEVVTPVADGMADGDMASPMQDADEGGDGDDLVELTSMQPPDPAVLARCQTVLAEVERRESQGLLDDEGDEDEVELSEEDIERYQHEPPQIDGSVMRAGNRPTFAEMPDEVDLAAVGAEELFLALESCFENGVLQEDELDDEGDAEFCAELAELSAEDVAAWVTEEGDEIVDEEFAWCDLTRPDRQ